MQAVHRHACVEDTVPPRKSATARCHGTASREQLFQQNAGRLHSPTCTCLHQRQLAQQGSRMRSQRSGREGFDVRLSCTWYRAWSGTLELATSPSRRHRKCWQSAASAQLLTRYIQHLDQELLCIHALGGCACNAPDTSVMLHRIDSKCQVSGLPASESNFLVTLVTHALLPCRQRCRCGCSVRLIRCYDILAGRGTPAVAQ